MDTLSIVIWISMIVIIGYTIIHRLPAVQFFKYKRRYRGESSSRIRRIENTTTDIDKLFKSVTRRYVVQYKPEREVLSLLNCVFNLYQSKTTYLGEWSMGPTSYQFNIFDGPAFESNLLAMWTNNNHRPTRHELDLIDAYVEVTRKMNRHDRKITISICYASSRLKNEFAELML